MSLGWEEDGIIEEEMIELCGSSDINDLILYCRSLKQDCVKHITEVKRLRYIADSIPDEVWEDMKTWESMKGVIE
tara:strand:+ start:4936 stop:5160 length:225 start_codon:yes stop_codon:yes gene_type:complete